MNEMLARPIAVKPRDGYRVWVKFDDGEEGEVDYSHIPRNGVFEAWNDREVFERVYISEFHTLTWPGGLELCPNSTYMRLTGKTVEELMPSLAKRLWHAGTVQVSGNRHTDALGRTSVFSDPPYYPPV